MKSLIIITNQGPLYLDDVDDVDDAIIKYKIPIAGYSIQVVNLFPRLLVAL